jgi:hypothetical protein
MGRTLSEAASSNDRMESIHAAAMSNNSSLGHLFVLARKTA